MHACTEIINGLEVSTYICVLVHSFGEWQGSKVKYCLCARDCLIYTYLSHMLAIITEIETAYIYIIISVHAVQF